MRSERIHTDVWEAFLATLPALRAAKGEVSRAELQQRIEHAWEPLFEQADEQIGTKIYTEAMLFLRREGIVPSNKRTDS